jgi:uncharacterized protein
MEALLSPVELAHSFSPEFLNLIIFPTEKCNFRCVYCYEDFKIGKMHSEVIDGIKNLIAHRSSSLKTLEISWFGGEPLLATDIVLDISTFIKRVLPPGVTYLGNMTTNGYFLTAPLARELIELGVQKFQISLDGPKSLHDRTRFIHSPGGTFDRIWSNLLSLKEQRDLKFQIILRIHFSPSTVTELDELIEELNGQFSEDERFCFYFKSIERLGGPNDPKLGKFQSWADKENARKALEAKVHNPAQIFKLRSADHGAYVCYAAKPNSLAIRADGSIAKCTVALYDDRNRIGSIQRDGKLSLDRDKLLSWSKGFETLDPLALACPMMSLDNTFKR